MRDSWNTCTQSLKQTLVKCCDNQLRMLEHSNLMEQVTWKPQAMSSHHHEAFCCTAGNCFEAGFRNLQAGAGSWDSCYWDTDLLGLPQIGGTIAVCSKKNARTEQEFRVYLILEGICKMFSHCFWLMGIEKQTNKQCCLSPLWKQKYEGNISCKLETLLAKDCRDNYAFSDVM